MGRHLNKRRVLAAIIWAVFTYVAFYDFYPKAAESFCDSLLSIPLMESFFITLSSWFSFNTPDSLWLATRLILVLGLGLNFILVALVFNKMSAWIFIGLSILILLTNTIASPLQLDNIRAYCDQLLIALSQPTLLLILIPIGIVYTYLEQPNEG